MQRQDALLEAERRLMYQGTARISLDVLHFGRDQPRAIDLDHVKFLTKCFRNEECQRLPIRNHVPALISQQQLANAMRHSGVSTEQLLAGQLSGYPMLKFPTSCRLECLHGRHRIEAAREFLLPTDSWWTVDLYLPKLNTNLRSWLVEEYSYEQKPTDGEIYRKLRQYDAERNLESKLRWKSRLQGIRPKSLTTLYKHEDLTDAFDALLVIPGLWDDMKLSTIHKHFPLRCDEEMLHYLRHVKRVWSGLVGGNKDAMSRIDTATVQALQMRAPRASTTDAKLLRSQLRAGEIFSNFDESEREDIWNKLRMIEGLIPSIFTFYRDVIYLENCVNCVKRLTTLSSGQSLSTAMKRRFTGVNQEPGQVKVQVTEDEFIFRQGTPEDQVDLGYRQLYAFAMRHWPDMPKKSQKVDPQMKTPTKADPAILRNFADLAAKLGFESDQITDLQQYSGCGNAPTESLESRPSLVTAGKGVHVKKRYGKQSTREFNEDKQFLFINHLHDERQEQGTNVTSFFVRKSVYLAFFGKPSARFDISQPDETSQSVGNSPSQSRGIDESNYSLDHNTNRSQRSSEHVMENYDGILTLYQQRDVRGEPRVPSNTTEEGAPERAEGSIDMSMQDWLEDQDRQRLEEERLEEERLERERLEHERLEHERLEQEQLEQQRLEQERLEKERKRRTQFDMEGVAAALRQAQERQQAQTSEYGGQATTGLTLQPGQEPDLDLQKEARQRQGRRTQERLEREKSIVSDEPAPAQQHRTTPRARKHQDSTLLAQEKSDFWVTFKIRERGTWRTAQTLHVYSSDPSEVERIALKYMRKADRIRVYDTDLNILTPQVCYEAALANRAHMLLLIPERETHINEELEASISQLLSEAQLEMESRIE